ncbi:non-hydrolyzing UDP-N-acetylglucosamine 2-epimerase [Isoptericola sp. b408]|uniref:non-hydrolyzing UDP-N-acetylglucosamine 2-epimerase n=1 Tax=Isoptericola sp. b408 TaxID=3064653 RepID=UPI002713B972|nr:UDP-N-acetylglucosamine 2-epimerase (non-hydrolyzing) [Isoptericola sp. b408]MDO8152299.1 UDP-N-acetylglucosamine 2-epimerase (non-hydrolyzing) [Isoptericola sp. b408]
MTVYGTRPEAIKVAPVVRALEASETLDSVTVVTGQHREMLDQVNMVFGITPDHDLNIMSHRQSLAQIFSRVLEGVDKVLEMESPSAVLVQGDTSTSTAAALAAFYRGIPVVHLEAGLRSGDISSPFPEEANRKLTTQIAALHLAPTTKSRDNLLAEGVVPDTVVVTGNTVIDALLATVHQAPDFDDPALVHIARSGRRIVLVTTHRRENWGSAMHGVGRALRRVADTYPDAEVILPAHRNPVVREAVLPHLAGAKNITVTEPLPYGQFTRLLNAADIIVTDSGGIQEEAPSLGIPVLVMRDNTERPEAVDAGTVRLVGTDEDHLVDAVSGLLDSREQYEAMANVINPYGDGGGARRAVMAIAHLLGIGPRADQWTEGKV